LNSNTLNEIQIPLKIDGMLIGVKDIDYDVEKKSLQRHKS
jgi:putative methionine-R-sulfoxide reductase with GAF domain